MIVAGSLLALGTLGRGLADEPNAEGDGQAVVELAGDAVEPGIWRLTGIAPGSPSSDLEPLRQLIGTAGVVALGESQHTSGGYYTAKHRLFRYLVERAGFRALAIESPWTAAESVGSYVSTCQGSAEDALQGLASIWQSAEVRDLVAWMCEWNRAHRKAKDRLSFVGFDVDQPEADGPALLAFLERIDIGAGHPLVEGVQRCDGVEGARAAPGAIVAADHAACLAALAEIGDRFARDAKIIARRTGKTDFEWAKVRRGSLLSAQEHSFYLRSDSVRSDEARDAGMADLLRAMQTLRLPKKTKVVTWAHNFHASKAPMPDPNGDFRTMGTVLGERLGGGYFVIGLIGWDVSWDLGGSCPRPPRAGASSLEVKLHGLGEQSLLVDTRTSSSVLDAGAAIEVSGVNGIADEHYQALVYLDSSAAMVPLFRPPC